MLGLRPANPGVSFGVLSPKVGHQRFRVGLDIHDVDQAAVLVQVSTFKSQSDLMVMPVPLVFCTPIACIIDSCRLR